MKTFTLPGTELTVPNVVLGLMRIAEKSDDDMLRVSAHFDDVTDAGEGEVADLMRPYYIEYLRDHKVTAADAA